MQSVWLADYIILTNSQLSAFKSQYDVTMEFFSMQVVAVTLFILNCNTFSLFFKNLKKKWFWPQSREKLKKLICFLERSCIWYSYWSAKHLWHVTFNYNFFKHVFSRSFLMLTMGRRDGENVANDDVVITVCDKKWPPFVCLPLLKLYRDTQFSL